MTNITPGESECGLSTDNKTNLESVSYDHFTDRNPSLMVHGFIISGDWNVEEGDTCKSLYPMEEWEMGF